MFASVSIDLQKHLHKTSEPTETFHFKTGDIHVSHVYAVKQLQIKK